MWEVEFYCDTKGRTPFVEYLDSLDTGMSAKTLRSVQLLRSEGTRLREPETKTAGGRAV